MKRFLLDTDIGADCDDAVAIAYLLGKQNEGRCTVAAITLSTARKYAPACARVLTRQFGHGEIPLGILRGVSLACDAMDLYAEDIAKQNGADHPTAEETPDAVTVMRKTLAEADAKTDIIAVGPQSNLRALLDSRPDAASPLCGADLIRQKVGTLYIMGGRFVQDAGTPPRADWNIAQDIGAARAVAARFPCRVVYCPHETGSRVTTYSDRTTGAVRDCMRLFTQNGAKKDGRPIPELSVYTRPSWDPLTAMVAIGEDMNFVLSPNGNITVDEGGVFHFREDPDGTRCFLTCKTDLSRAESLLNDMVAAFCARAGGEDAHAAV